MTPSSILFSSAASVNSDAGTGWRRSLFVAKLIREMYRKEGIPFGV